MNIVCPWSNLNPLLIRGVVGVTPVYVGPLDEVPRSAPSATQSGDFDHPSAVVTPSVPTALRRARGGKGFRRRRRGDRAEYPGAATGSVPLTSEWDALRSSPKLDPQQRPREQTDYHTSSRGSSRRVITTRTPSRTCLKAWGLPRRWPITVTGLAGRISSPLLAGVGPKKMQNARPTGQ